MIEYFVILILVILIIFYRSKFHSVENQLKEIQFQKKSLSSKYGKMTEQFFPFMKSFPYDEQNFRFIGSPIDGVQFEKDKIIFLEFKTGDSRLTQKQKDIEFLVKNKKVEFKELNIK